MSRSITLPPVKPSVLSRLDPRWRLCGLLLAAIVAMVLRTLPATVGCWIQALILILLARVTPSWYGSRMGTLALALSLFLLPLPWIVPSNPGDWHWGTIAVSSRGIQLALLIACRAAAIVTLSLVILTTASLDNNLKACHALGMPGVLVQIGILTYRYLFLLLEELNRLRIALRVRGFRNRANSHGYRLVGNLTGMLLVRASERSERVSQAMACRGFAGQFRTLTPFHSRVQDVLFLAGMVLIQVALLWIEFQGS